MTIKANASMQPAKVPLFVTLGLCLLAAAHGQSRARRSVWTKEEVQCAPENAPAAIHRSTCRTSVQCTMKASQNTGALVAQFSQLTLTCTVFNFQSICRHLIPGQTPNCAVFYRFPINHRLMNAKLNNVWLADAVSRLENLVCQADEDTNRLHPVAVQWSSDGAVFDGAAAHAVLNRSSINFATGLTWLLRIKRQPREQPFIEFVDCSNMGSTLVHGAHMWEHLSPRQMYARRSRVTGVQQPLLYSPVDVLSASPTEWLNLGFTSNAAGSSFDLFVMNGFIPRGGISSASDSDIAISSLCMHVGMRVASPTNYLFTGSVRALALASVSMSEEEIRQFFSLLE